MTKAEATGGEQAHKQREALAATMARGSTVRVLTTARSVTLELQTNRIPTALRKETIFGLLDLFTAKVRRSHHYGTCQLPRLVYQNQSDYYHSSRGAQYHSVCSMSDNVQNAAALGGPRGVVEAACMTVNEMEIVPVHISTLGNHRTLSILEW